MIDAFLCDLGKILSEKPAGNNVSLSITIFNINKFKNNEMFLYIYYLKLIKLALTT